MKFLVVFALSVGLLFANVSFADTQQTGISWPANANYVIVEVGDKILRINTKDGSTWLLVPGKNGTSEWRLIRG